MGSPRDITMRERDKWIASETLIRHLAPPHPHPMKPIRAIGVNRTLPGSQRIFLAVCNAGGVFEFDAVTGETARIVAPCGSGVEDAPIGPQAGGAILSPDGQWILTCDGSLAVRRKGELTGDWIGSFDDAVYTAFWGDRLLVGTGSGTIHVFAHDPRTGPHGT
jgi:hypothetical protein